VPRPILVRFAQVVSGHFDAGIQLRGGAADNMVAVRVSGAIERIVVGTPTCLRQHLPPRTPEDSSEHNYITAVRLSEDHIRNFHSYSTSFGVDLNAV
jgi:hypothetical protein